MIMVSAATASVSKNLQKFKSIRTENILRIVPDTFDQDMHVRLQDGIIHVKKDMVINILCIPALKGTNASLGHSLFKNLSGLKDLGSTQYFAIKVNFFTESMIQGIAHDYNVNLRH
jgi:hypothetical protein